MADAEDLKSSALKRLVGSRPSPGTTLIRSSLSNKMLLLAAALLEPSQRRLFVIMYSEPINNLEEH